MSLRTRLGLGIVSITIILLVPLILALRSLEQVHQTTRTLRDREFAGSLILGRFRELTDDVMRQEDAMSIIGDSTAYRRMRQQLDRLASIGDSLAPFSSRQSATDISTAILALRASTIDDSSRLRNRFFNDALSAAMVDVALQRLCSRDSVCERLCYLDAIASL